MSKNNFIHKEEKGYKVKLSLTPVVL